MSTFGRWSSVSIAYTLLTEALLPTAQLQRKPSSRTWFRLLVAYINPAFGNWLHDRIIDGIRGSGNIVVDKSSRTAMSNLYTELISTNSVELLAICICNRQHENVISGVIQRP